MAALSTSTAARYILAMRRVLRMSSSGLASSWYAKDGLGNVAAYLASLDLTGFDPKAPPRKTRALWAIVDANRAPEDAELSDVLDRLESPDAVTIARIANEATGDFQSWMRDRKNRRQIPHRLEQRAHRQEKIHFLFPIRKAVRDGCSTL
jgi:hypothetical protein